MAAYRQSRVPNGSSLLEQQNDELSERLSEKVMRLKRVAISIGDEVRDQNMLLNGMETSFDSTRSILASTMKKLGIVSRTGGKNVLCYLILFAFFVFLIIYYCIH